MLLRSKLLNIQFGSGSRTKLEPFWGVKTVAIFDVWSIEHFLMGMSVGAGVVLYNRKNLYQYLKSIPDKLFHPKKIDLVQYKYDVIFVLGLAYLWETVEHYLETWIGGQWLQNWLQGVEFWPNRLITDPLMVILGYFFVKKFPGSCWVARGLSLVWLVVHLFIFPHSMYLHELF